MWDLDRRRVLIAAGAFALIGLVGLVDGQVSGLAFSPFYLIPVCLVTWFVARAAGVVAAAAASALGLGVEIWWGKSALGYAYANAGLRLALLTVAALILGRLQQALSRERRVADLEREAAALRAQLMRSVAQDAREPLGQIYANVVDLGFEMSDSGASSRAVLHEIASASTRLTELVDTLLLEDEELSISP
jgi:signal transduction histidine kinase